MQMRSDIQEIEHGWYEWWESQNFFRIKNGRKRFVMLLPPPNITGKLHMGHALTCAIQDAIMRCDPSYLYVRNQMKGYEVVWIPGFDHAGIATQAVVERHVMETKKLTKYDLGKKGFLKEVQRWKDDKEDIMKRQLRRMGIAIDWSRSTFTMDPKISLAVNKAIEKLFDLGLLYRSEMMINWCCSLQSVISDAEVNHLDIDGPTPLSVPKYQSPVMFGYMYDIGYRLQDSSEIVFVSTTRPETIFGDTGLMVSPNDQRYSHLRDKMVHHPFLDRLLPIILDTRVDPNFGTGVVKVTPSNSFEDFHIGKAHDLPVVDFIDDGGCITGIPTIEGMPRFEARNWALEQLASRGLYRGKRVHRMKLPVCSRTGDVVEPRLKYQWFIKMETLTRAAVTAVEAGQLSLQPEQYRKVWDLFLSSNRDWCISRQLWWGHRMPIYWISTKGNSVFGSEEEIKAHSAVFVAASSQNDAISKGARQLGVDISAIVSVARETDVLDTWFSSGLLPFAVLGWPDKDAEDFKKYYPISLMETGHDIIFFWVARMVMLGLALTDQLPFKEVLLHSIVCDEERHKMSKSRGNDLDPMDIMEGRPASSSKEILGTIPICGSDALRFSLCSYNIKEWMISLDLSKMEQNALFRNKMWQTIRFLLTNLEKIPDGLQCLKTMDEDAVQNIFDLWILSRLSELVTKAHTGFDNYNLHEVTRALKNFWYTYLCDIYLEAIKPRLWNTGDLDSSQIALSVLYSCCHTALLILSPFMPFLSEELYQHLPSAETKYDSIMQCPAPPTHQWEHFRDLELEDCIGKLVEATSSLRSLRKAFEVKVVAKGNGTMFIAQHKVRKIAESLHTELARLSFLNDLKFETEDETQSQLGPAKVRVVPGISVQLHLEGLMDFEKEEERIKLKISSLKFQKQKLQLKMSRLQTQSFENVAKHEQKLKLTEESLKQYEEQLETIRKLR